MISFVKELDQPTLDFVRQFDRAAPMLSKQHHKLKLYVVWVGGDEKKLKRWANANKIANVGLGVIANDARNLNLWRISRKSVSTTVLLRRRTPGACFINLTPGKLDEIEDEIEEQFRHLRR